MNKTQARKRIEKLKKLINRYRYEYHVLDTQEISDAAHDALKHELQELEDQFPDLVTPDSPTQRVGGEPLKKFNKVIHSKRMLSLVDIFSYNELVEWESRIKKLRPDVTFEYFVELKIDGFAIALLYEDGVLVTAATRGDSYVGEDVTQNVKIIEAIPLKLERLISGRVEVRGEIFMTKQEFERINKEQERRGEPLYANPRNLAAGTIRQLDPQFAAARKLDFFAYEIVAGVEVSTKVEEHRVLQELGFKVIQDNKLVRSIAEVQDFYERWIDKRNKQKFLIDGLVVKVNDNKVRDSLGIAGKAPRGMVAYKFPAEQTTTVVKQVDWSVGRTGVLTPLATFEPVQVAGTTVQHATLHNWDEIQRLGIQIGDTVIIEKAGDIIPKVVSVLPELRDGTERPIELPVVCPVCGSPVVKKKEDDVAYYCTNKKCFATEVERLIHFVSKKGLNIEGLGEKIIEQLAQNGLVRSYADIFRLHSEDLLQLEGFAAKSAAKTVEAINAARTVDLHRLIYALGIRYVGEETAMRLAREAGTLERLRAMSREELEAVPDIGGVVAQSITEYFADAEHARELDVLVKELTIISPQPQQQTLAGMTFVITGTLQRFTRDEVKDMIRDQGGHVSESVSKKTDYVIVGAEAGSKVAKAKALGVPMISEEAFLELLQKKS